MLYLVSSAYSALDGFDDKELLKIVLDVDILACDTQAVCSASAAHMPTRRTISDGVVNVLTGITTAETKRNNPRRTICS